jgi:hypothetical protein
MTVSLCRPAAGMCWPAHSSRALHADERSPLCGHTHDSLIALNAEIVVTFEGTTEVCTTGGSCLPCCYILGGAFCKV